MVNRFEWYTDSGKQVEVTEIDNRLAYEMSRRDIKGVGMGWGMKPALQDKYDKIIESKAARILFPLFYKNSKTDWPTCPYTGMKMPTVSS